jgi:hypothetical protein
MVSGDTDAYYRVISRSALLCSALCLVTTRLGVVCISFIGSGILLAGLRRKDSRHVVEVTPSANEIRRRYDDFCSRPTGSGIVAAAVLDIR